MTTTTTRTTDALTALNDAGIQVHYYGDPNFSNYDKRLVPAVGDFAIVLWHDGNPRVLLSDDGYHDNLSDAIRNAARILVGWKED